MCGSIGCRDVLMGSLSEGGAEDLAGGGTSHAWVCASQETNPGGVNGASSAHMGKMAHCRECRAS